MTDEFTTGNAITVLIALASPIGSFLMMGRKIRRENEADTKALVDPVSAELKSLQKMVADHVPRAEIEKADDAVRRIAEQAARDVGDLRVAQGRMEQRVDGVVVELGEIKSLVKEQGRDTKAGFDKLQDCLTEINRKVG